MAQIHKLTYTQLKKIEYCLRHLLATKGHGLTYLITKNLASVNKSLTELAEIRKQITDHFVIKDEQGRPVLFETKLVDNVPHFVFTEQNEYIPVTGNKKPGSVRIDEFNPEYIASMEAFRKDVVETDLFPFSQEEIDSLYSIEENKDKDLSPLFGNIIP